MFEFIGLAIATGILLGLAVVASIVLAGLTWLCLRNRHAPRKRLMLAATLLPILSAAYLWFCVALLPYESLFGDISQPLPNGYMLQALGKMPDFASISNPKMPNSYNGLSECIGRLAVYGPLVIGQYSHPFGSFEAKPDEPFFVFDTSNGQHTDLPSLIALEGKVDRPVNLVEVQFFRSTEPGYIKRHRANEAIEFGPPIILLLALIMFIGRYRAGIPAPPPNIYT
jgi:hypothetical protein